MNDKVTVLFKELQATFPFTPTREQEALLRSLSEFFLRAPRFSVYILKGYAGTGKTTVIGSLVENLKKVGLRYVLLAPTGRAAKVMAQYSGKQAHTIHRKIYYCSRAGDGRMKFTLQANKHENTIFIVDEASMIPDRDPENLFAASLLEDLMRYVYRGKHCRMLFLGDMAQLPPVKLELSPALDPEVFRSAFHMEVFSCELTEVMRQHADSGILANATMIRNHMANASPDGVKFNLELPDVVRLEDPYEIQDAVYNCFGRETDQAIVIVRSNKRANLYNQQIRISVLGLDDEITSGDMLMVVKNNYYWMQDSEQVGFIANGDVGEILEIFAIRDLYGFRFAEVKMRLVDYPSQPPFETIIMLDTLHSETASLSFEESNRLYEAVSEDYREERNKYKRRQLIKNNKYFNALQVKFSYAMTCHKTQGGQWENVFLEQPYLPDGEDISYLRWLYTGVTRARKKLYLIGFKEEYFEN